MRDWSILDDLWLVIQDRAEHPSPESYVTSVLTHRKGIDKSLEKVGEEAVEFILAAKNRVPERTVSEAADLLFHLLVALQASGTDVADVLDELAARRK
ncbi:MAG: phosphoribosyl-ATP pyrophosphatase [Euryarchaeota archaeon ADurb.Bin009]|jgi:phosphoribosyl-ATP pyrophosphohydrolase|uniref:phosphoribosyl-ATP diphosphatase n=1 Tax=Methanoculleus sp. TaxID=90427 RepID=UPI0009CC9C3B|nr:phosphoribosyl-ATP diphosphatase [Methanoculleus sp.]OQC71795.1 MAG: phosphoribosyl-ATP pyrophosphatase [Euryarchaeota archaeon ADurb.Bin009]MBP7144746.1 phosphoribosyl-ATP diphosphatase [Methanoculleus sp.]HNT07357.1 phosphoribosyl-ATP diphosphatase [Methanoculleus sp.]HNV39723.1 phosphoribosyl-ATP diphosphatase [Methanoculleus sp.]HOC83802.1 phosphoribosyl-ATP diphosphatase [Methanoculleus sp.]